MSLIRSRHLIGNPLFRHLPRSQFSSSSSSSSSPSASASISSPGQAFAYCSQLVKTHDYSNYLCSLFLPEPLRSVQWGLRAFNVEISRVGDVAKNHGIAKMRLQFWREAVDQIFLGRPPQNPVAISLAESLRVTKLSKMWFKRIIDERDKLIDNSSFATMAQVETYAENTASALLYLSLESAGYRSVSIDHAASHLGKAVGLATIIRGTPFHIRERNLLIPVELLTKHNVVEEDVYRGEINSNFLDAVFDMAVAANDQLMTARMYHKEVPKEAVPLLLSAVPCELFLKDLEKSNFDIFKSSLTQRSYKLPFALLKHNWKNTF